MNLLTESAVAPAVNNKIKVKLSMSKEGSCYGFSLEGEDSYADLYVKAGNRIVFPYGTPPTEIEFKVHGQAGQTLDFDTADPIWVAEGGCPQAKGSGHGHITIVDPKLNSLTILNSNGGETKVELHYRLNFLGGYSWDPIILNEGGGGRIFE